MTIRQLQQPRLCTNFRALSSSAIAYSSSPYTVLGLSVTATPKQIKARFYELSKKFHPDRNRHKSKHKQDECHAKFLKAKEAYEVLIDPLKKAGIDKLESTSQYGAHRSARGHFYRPNPSNRTTTTTSSWSSSSSSSSSSGYKRTRVFNHGRPYNPGPMEGFTYGSNYDVPHFDFDRHYNQQKSYEDHRTQQRKAQKEQKNKSQTTNTNQIHHTSNSIIALSIVTVCAVSYVTTRFFL